MDYPITQSNQPVIGFETKKARCGGDYKSRNIGRAISYIPVVGTIVGIMRFCFFAKGIQNSESGHRKTWKNRKWQTVGYIGRTTVETLSLGILFTVPDLITTAVRQKKQSRYLSGFEKIQIIESFNAKTCKTITYDPPKEIWVDENGFILEIK